MAIEIPTNTALYIPVGPFLDKTDGISPELSITVANSAITLIAGAADETAPTVVLDSVAGNDGTNTLTHITDEDAGMYYLKLTAANNNRYGKGVLIIEDTATYVTVFHEIQWVSAQYYAMKYGTTILNSNITQVSGDSDAADNLELMFDGTGYAGGTAKLQVDLTKVLGTALTETGSGYLAAAIKKLFDVASPQLTAASKDQTGDSYPIVSGTIAEPSQGAPPDSPTLIQAINYLYRKFHHKNETTATEKKVYNAAGDTVLFKETHSDNGTTFTKGKYGTGA